jgi:DNA-binding GntR family transcriptional regulator
MGVSCSRLPTRDSGIRQRAEALEGIVRLVVSGTLAIGEKTSELRIAEQLGVSRTPVREALAVLARDGVVVQRAQVGVWVRHVPTRELAELTQVAYQIETLAINVLIEGGIEEHLSALTLALEALRTAANRWAPDDHLAQDAFLEAETSLHLAVSREGGLDLGTRGIELWGVKRRLYHVEHPIESRTEVSSFGLASAGSSGRGAFEPRAEPCASTLEGNCHSIDEVGQR